MVKIRVLGIVTNGLASPPETKIHFRYADKQEGHALIFPPGKALDNAAIANFIVSSLKLPAADVIIPLWIDCGKHKRGCSKK